MDSPHLQGMGSAVLQHDVGADDHDPAEPAVLGYHEVFHLLVIAGVAAHFPAISLFALPTE
jgi:predicted membrane channel-forming protein YqfA (hemolysin III family)